jgi:peptide/nickel transport system substrate-binding protein
VVSADGKTVSVTIRGGLQWDTSPPRDVTAADVVRGIKRACNPSPQSFGGMADFESTIVGLSAFCAGYPAAAATSAPALKAYVEGHNVPGITTSGDTITFRLTQPAVWLEDAMTLPPFSAVPVEAENGLPGTAAVYDHMYSDGPYRISKYTPGKTLDFVRNPVWQASTDPLRKAYVDAINVDETGTQSAIFDQIGTNSPSAGMAWGVQPPPAAIPGLLSRAKRGSPDIAISSTYSSNPYLAFNTISPNQGHALGKLAVRQALEYALNRGQLIQAYGGPSVNTPLTHVLPPGTGGAEDLPASYDPYPYNPGKAKSLLASAGFTAGNPLTLKFLYRTDSVTSARGFADIQQQLASLGVVKVVGKAVSSVDFYGSKYLYDPSSPTPASQGVWDLALTGWAPDWYGEAAVNWFNPLLASPGGFPANGGSNFGYFSSPTVNADIAQALAAPSADQADKLWAQADEDAMAVAPFYPITDPLQIAVHADYVHNAVYMPQYQQFDPANVWLSTPGS